MSGKKEEKVEENPNIFVLEDDDSEYEDFDGDDTMEKLLELFLFHRKDATLIDYFQLISFIIFFFVNVGCVSYNLYKAITSTGNTGGINSEKEIFSNNKSIVNNMLFERSLNFSSLLNSTNSGKTGVIIDGKTKILYITEFTVICVFLVVALYNYFLLFFNSSSKSHLSNAANFTRLVREFSCFSLVPLFNVSNIMNIYKDIADTFDKEKKKYADRSKLWDGIWGMSTKDVQKSNSMMELNVEEENHDQLTTQPGDDDEEMESRFKRFKHSKVFLRLISVAIYTGFFVSIVLVLGLAVFAFLALYVKTRHVGNFIVNSNDDDIYKWFNFVTFIMNIASLTQQSPAIKLIIYQLKVLTKKAHHNKYRRRKQNRIKENKTRFDANKEEEGIQVPKIIIHRKRISRAADDSEIDRMIINSEISSYDADALASSELKHKGSKLS